MFKRMWTLPSRVTPETIFVRIFKDTMKELIAIRELLETKDGIKNY